MTETTQVGTFHFYMTVTHSFCGETFVKHQLINIALQNKMSHKRNKTLCHKIIRLKKFFLRLKGIFKGHIKPFCFYVTVHPKMFDLLIKILLLVRFSNTVPQMQRVLSPQEGSSGLKHRREGSNPHTENNLSN